MLCDAAVLGVSKHRLVSGGVVVVVTIMGVLEVRQASCTHSSLARPSFHVCLTG